MSWAIKLGCEGLQLTLSQKKSDLTFDHYGKTHFVTASPDYGKNEIQREKHKLHLPAYEYMHLRTVMLDWTGFIRLGITSSNAPRTGNLWKGCETFPLYTLPAICGLSVSWCQAYSHTIMFSSATNEAIYLSEASRSFISPGFWISLL